MPKKYDHILKHNHREESLMFKFLFNVYVALECLLKKIDTCHNNPEK